MSYSAVADEPLISKIGGDTILLKNFAIAAIVELECLAQPPEVAAAVTPTLQVILLSPHANSRILNESIQG